MNLRTVTLIGPTGETVTLGTLTSGAGYTLESTVFDAADRAQLAAPLPLVTGGVVAPGRLSFRTLRMSGVIVATSDAQAAQLARELVFALRDAGTDSVLVRYTPEATELELAGFLTGTVALRPVDGSMWLRYDFELQCPDPVALAGPQTQSIATPVVNGGSAPTWPTITATLTGVVTSLRVGSTTTGEFVQLDGLSGTVAEVVIRSRPGFETVELDGVAGLDKLNVASTFFPLLPGANDLYVTVLAGTGSATAQVDWRDGYLL